MSMVMGPGQLGAVYMWVRGTTGQWGLGSQGSGHCCQRGRGEWGVWGPFRGGQGRGFCVIMGRLPVGCVSVGCVVGLGLTAQCWHLPRMRWWFLSMHLEFSSEIVDFNLRWHCFPYLKSRKEQNGTSTLIMNTLKFLS